MKSICLLFLAIVTGLTTVQAQNYYPSGQIVKGKEVEYACSLDGSVTIVENVANKFKGQKSGPLSGQQEDTSDLPSYWLNRPDNMKWKEIAIFKEVFSPEEIERFIADDRKRPFFMDIIARTDGKGHILEVYFALWNNTLARSISPDKLYEFERRIIKELVLSETPEYKNYNFVELVVSILLNKEYYQRYWQDTCHS